MSEWITDRLPTEDDAVDDWVFIMHRGDAVLWLHSAVELGVPWQPVQVPDPYVKPKRWTVEWVNMFGYWALIDGENRVPIYGFTRMQREAAQRIADIYNEVMP
jgi:hypothetical protein